MPPPSQAELPLMVEASIVSVPHRCRCRRRSAELELPLMVEAVDRQRAAVVDPAAAPKPAELPLMVEAVMVIVPALEIPAAECQPMLDDVHEPREARRVVAADGAGGDRQRAVVGDAAAVDRPCPR